MTSNDHHHHVHVTVSPNRAGGSRGREEELASNINKRLDIVLDAANKVILETDADGFGAACRNVILNVKAMVDEELQIILDETN